jgi:hypothetical protein
MSDTVLKLSIGVRGDAAMSWINSTSAFFFILLFVTATASPILVDVGRNVVFRVYGGAALIWILTLGFVVDAEQFSSLMASVVAVVSVALALWLMLSGRRNAEAHFLNAVLSASMFAALHAEGVFYFAVFFSWALLLVEMRRGHSTQ